MFHIHLWMTPEGEVTGSSYDVKESGTIIASHVMPDAGPFDTPRAVFAVVLADILDRYGVRMRII